MLTSKIHMMARIRFLLILLLTGQSWLASAQLQDTLIPRELFFQPKDIFEVVLSPDAKRVYYQRQSAEGKKLFFRGTAASDTEQALTFSGQILSWLPTYSGQLLIYLEQDDQRRLYLSDPDGQTLKNITPFPVQSLRLEAISQLFPNKVTLSIVAKDPQRSGVYLLDFKNGRNEMISGPLEFQKLYFDGDLAMCAAVSTNQDGGKTIFRRHDNAWVEVSRYPFDESMFLGGFQDVVSVGITGDKIYITDNLNKDKTTLVEVDLETGEKKELVADAKADILPYGPIVGGDGWPHMVMGVFGEAHRHYLQRDTREDFEWLDRRFDGAIGFAGASADNRYWLVRRINGGPMHYYLFRRSRRELTFLFSDFPQLDTFALAERHTFSITTRDGLELPLQVYLPAGADKNYDGIPDQPLPTVLYVHGGPWVGVTHWNNWFHTRNFQLLANRGYAVINTEFRGTTGLGKLATRFGDRQWGEAMHRDLLDIADWAAEQLIADADSTAVWGWSYGGYAAAAALTFAPQRFACGLAMYGPADLDAFSRISFTNTERWRRTVGDPYTIEGAELLKKHSPAQQLHRIEKPLLLTTGSQDDRVPQVQINAFANALAKAGKEVLYFYYPDEGHDYRFPESWISFWAVAERFLHDQLGGKYQPAGEDLKRGNFVVVYGKEYVEGME